MGPVIVVASLLSWLVPGPHKHVKSWPFWLLEVVSGHYFTYIWGSGMSRT